MGQDLVEYLIPFIAQYHLAAVVQFKVVVVSLGGTEGQLEVQIAIFHHPINFEPYVIEHLLGSKTV